MQASFGRGGAGPVRGWEIRRLREDLWGVFDPWGHPCFWLHRHEPEWQIRRHCPRCGEEGGGPLVAVFYGVRAFEEACEWCRRQSREELLEPAS